MSAKNTQVSVRLPADLLARVDALVAEMNAERPGLDHGRAEAIKVMIASYPSGGSQRATEPAVAKKKR